MLCNCISLKIQRAQCCFKNLSNGGSGGLPKESKYSPYEEFSMYIAIQCFPGLSCGSVLQIIRIGPSEFDHVGTRSQANTPTNIRVHIGSFRSIDSILFPFIFSSCSQKARSSSDQSPKCFQTRQIVLGKPCANFMSSRTLPCLSKLKCSPSH